MAQGKQACMIREDCYLYEDKKDATCVTPKNFCKSAGRFYLLGRTDTPKPVEVGAEEVAKAREFKEALKKFVDETGV